MAEAAEEITTLVEEVALMWQLERIQEKECQIQFIIPLGISRAQDSADRLVQAEEEAVIPDPLLIKMN